MYFVTTVDPSSGYYEKVELPPKALHCLPHQYLIATNPQYCSEVGQPRFVEKIRVMFPEPHPSLLSKNPEVHSLLYDATIKPAFCKRASTAGESLTKL